MAGETILHIGYDSVLLELRNAVLARARYHVISLLGNDAVRQSAKNAEVDLVVIGSGGHYAERREIAAWLTENLPGTRVLAMCLSPDERFPDGVFQFYGDTPRDWLIAVESTLERRRARSKH